MRVVGPRGTGRGAGSPWSKGFGLRSAGGTMAGVVCTVQHGHKRWLGPGQGGGRWGRGGGLLQSPQDRCLGQNVLVSPSRTQGP